MDRRVSLVPRSEIASQPTQLLQHALAPAPKVLDRSRDWGLARDGNSTIDFSLDSRIIPARSPAVPPHYNLLTEDSQKEKRQKSGELAGTDIDAPAQGSGSELLTPHGDSSISASVAAKVTRTRSVSFHSPPNTLAHHPLSRPTKSMPVGNRHYRRSPSFPSQDSFGGPVSQDPAEHFLASTKQFHMPLSDLGETPTQEVIHSPTDPEATLPDASEHKEFLEAAMRKYDEERAKRLPSNRRGANILVAATPSNSGESLGTQQHDDFSFHNNGPEFAAQESRFEFNGSSSFDKMLDRGLADAPDPTPEPIQAKQIEPPQADDLVDVGDDVLTTPPQSSGQRSPSPPFDWIAPNPSADIASSNPRSLLRMVHPNNRYRIAKMRNLVGKVEPPSYITTGVETQPSGIDETQPCHAGGSTALSPTRPTLRQTKAVDPRPTSHQLKREDEELEDALDIVPDSEPLRAGSSTQTPSHNRTLTQSPLKKVFRPLSPMSEHGSGDLMPDSLEVEGSEVDVPLAIEVASKSTKRAVARTENVAVHDNKTRTASRAAPTKTPILALGKQPQRPTSSSAMGKNSRARPSKKEPTEVPTSLPEQDLQGQAFSSAQHPTATTNMLLSKKKRGDPETLKPSLARPTSTTRLPVTKPVASNKRARKSDTESSEDSTCQPTEDEEATHSRKKKKEEEEESEWADDHDADLAPPPLPPKHTSRQKRRRTEDTNPARETSKASTSTRNKQSETPAIVTRSAKRVRSGVSSTRGLTVEPATRVFALWKQDGHYYSGVVHSRGPKNKYLVKFDDGTQDEVELKNMRRQELLVGDRVIIIQDNIKAVVSDVSHGDSHSSFTLEADNGKEVTTRPCEIRIANRTIQSQWKGRAVMAENINTVVRPKTPIDTTPSRQSVTSATSGKVQRELVKTGFVVTINPKNEQPTQMKDEAMRAIRQHGGLVIEDWSSVFTMEGKHSQSNKRWIATPQDFRWKSEVNLDRVFLLSDDAHQKPKFLLALALGIPCLSFEWLTREGKFSSDWQPFLLPAGYSDTLGARISQLVDLDWGNCTEHLTDIMESEVPIKLFSQKTVLCVGAELVPLPPHRAKKNNSEEASRYVPWIILCMGAAKVEAVTDTKQVSLAHMQTFDYIIVKERHVLGPLKLGDDIVGDVNWVKECLVSSRLSVPKLD